MDGTVVAVVAEEGRTVNANQTAPTIVMLARLDVVTVNAEISEADVVKIKPGMPVYSPRWVTGPQVPRHAAPDQSGAGLDRQRKLLQLQQFVQFQFQQRGLLQRAVRRGESGRHVAHRHDRAGLGTAQAGQGRADGAGGGAGAEAPWRRAHGAVLDDGPATAAQGHGGHQQWRLRRDPVRVEGRRARGGRRGQCSCGRCRWREPRRHADAGQRRRAWVRADEHDGAAAAPARPATRVPGR